ncbi:MAG: branched-chain amino acid ABC transporter substrate-binding protein [Desulforhabdus sp.]|jgi:branched-chain amino acid transport system substrate-binding protein|nr:branched-chain amino acid ABC transporter substrate-binding protein [Desulforhabdus sp.]
MKKLLAFVLLLHCCCAGSQPIWAESIKIGVIGPISGPLANEGEQMRLVVQLLADDLNSGKGLLGNKVEIITVDDQGTTQSGVAAAQELIEQKVVAVIGSYPSSVTAAVQGIFGDAKIIQITNASTAVPLSETGIKTFFRICPRDDDQAEAAVGLITEQGYKKVAILRDSSLYSKDLADNTRSRLTERKIAISFDDVLPDNHGDYKAILARIQKTNPDVVFFTGYYPEAAGLLRQKREMRWDVPFIGGDACDHPDLVDMAGKKAVQGFRFLSLPRPENLPSPEARQFRAEFERKYRQRVSSIYALLAGDAFKVLISAIANTKSTAPEKLADYLHKMGEYQGLTGSISFDEKGDREGVVFVDYQLNDQGKAVLHF